MLEKLKERVFKANLELKRSGLVILTWGNVSGIDRETGYVVIKPSGVDYDEMTAEDMVVVDADGRTVEGSLRPSSDTPTHLVLYKAFPEIGGVVHTHSTFATAWAQAGRDIPDIGTTHADSFHLDIPCTGELSDQEIDSRYEAAQGDLIARCFADKDPIHTPAVLVRHHGPFTWGASPEEAVKNAVILEEVAKMAAITVALNPQTEMNPRLVEKHFSRKHGAKAYYGQK